MMPRTAASRPRSLVPAVALALAVLAPHISAAPALPGPLGGPQIAVDVNTMIGRRASGFALPDGDGKVHRVVPGRGRPLVVISHMGFY
jgi:hypothetical protein